ncbi:predicted protein [Uncinocarpus reesii 1704]|uniref:Uncharacterized protein n=1 Tax=Uncinocarpus reesii (strain UAMH 1704) TaxID=336963 RepID=C4JSC6_UNCRE|nr:uncharacterized protein UREG_05365 [Uncinocarpus reesii 1704]EEP80523.1 predicted protein [Uncinocarpus reesii 1704]
MGVCPSKKMNSGRYDRPDLAPHVRSFTWTLAWINHDEDDLIEIDYELWNVFSRLTNVRHLDLASLHDIFYLSFIRENPSRLFPAVSHLRLIGWMHRGLVEAIVNSLDPAAVTTIILDFLQDEGAFPNGAPMAEDVAEQYARDTGLDMRPGALIDEDLYERQRTGTAFSFVKPQNSSYLSVRL